MEEEKDILNILLMGLAPECMKTMKELEKRRRSRGEGGRTRRKRRTSGGKIEDKPFKTTEKMFSDFLPERM